MGSATVQGELWGKAPRLWAELQEPMHRPLWEAMLHATKVRQGSRVLDAGCGGGGACILAAKRGALVSGLDAAESLLRIAHERLSDGDFRVGDMETLPYSDESFDAVIACNSLQYTLDRIAALRELRRVCTLQGRIAVGLWSTPDQVDNRFIVQAIREALPEQSLGKGPFELSYPGILETLIEQAGMHVAETGEVECSFEYADFETFWQSRVGAGPIQSALQVLGKAKLTEVLRAAVTRFMGDDGRIRMSNWFRYVTATP